LQYDPLDALAILDRNVRDQDLQLSKVPGWESWIEGWKTAGPAYTLVIEGEVVACAGVTILEPGKGEAWALLSTLFYQYPKTAYKAIRKGLEDIIREKGLKRVQAFVKCGTGVPTVDTQASCRFLEHLGFVNETPNAMKAYHNGHDYYMFARVI
jgi:hypothetical protein